MVAFEEGISKNRRLKRQHLERDMNDKRFSASQESLCQKFKQRELLLWRSGATRNHEVAGWIPGLAQWLKDPALL